MTKRRYMMLVTLPIFGAMAFFIGHERPGSSPSPATTASALPPFEAEVPLPPPRQHKPIVFKWQDEHGAWHYADVPPTDPNVETRVMSPDTGTLSMPPAHDKAKPSPRS